MNLRTRVMVIGGVLGALVGVLAAHLYLRSAAAMPGEEGEAELPAVQPGDAIKLSLGILGVLRLITGLGESAG
jgi:hypothetical protein